MGIYGPCLTGHASALGTLTSSPSSSLTLRPASARIFRQLRPKIRPQWRLAVSAALKGERLGALRFHQTKGAGSLYGLRKRAGRKQKTMAEDLGLQLIEAAAAVSEVYGADVYAYSGPIDDDGLGRTVTAIAKHKTKDTALLILTTNGGSANTAYQIARIFQKMYDEFIVCTPSYCKSAGTLIALGAHRLLVDMVSELGPLDVQLYKQNEIGARKSGLLARSSFQALAEASFELYERLMMGITMRSGGLVSFKLASELSASMASNLLAPVYGQINPDIVGSETRDLNIALQYGLRLIRHSENASPSSVIELIEEYPSHDFIIDDDEIRQLFKNVEVPSNELYTLIGLLRELAYDESPSTVVLGLTRPRKEKEKAHEHGQPIGGETPSSGTAGGGKKVDADRRPNRKRDPKAAEQRPPGGGSSAPADQERGSTPPAANTDKPEEKEGPPLRVVRDKQ